MIYVLLRGRIGNQLFIYAMAEALREKRGLDEEIVIDDAAVLQLGWTDSLKFYDLPNVRFVHDHSCNLLQFLLLRMYHRLTRGMSYNKKFKFEKKFQRFFNKFGLVVCENGFLDVNAAGRNILIDGYFQSENYFKDISAGLKARFLLSEVVIKSNYPNLELIQNRNSVCISIKVEHNVGDSFYDVCNDGYWEKAINLMTEKVDQPLFFICSDNVEYVKENLIDCTKYDVVCQDKNFPVHISLAVMALCKHFIIGNTTFGWWAQYLSKNSSDRKIVIAPSRWMRVDMPIDIYQNNWILIEV